MITNRPLRLRGVDYRGFNHYFLTTCTAFRRSLFDSADAVGPVLRKLDELSKSHGFSVPAHCAMPDHLHVLIEGLSENSDFRHFVRVFKQITAFEFRQRAGAPLWQPGYHERILRDDEHTLAVVRYVWENPVRAGLARQLGEYPYCGSDRYELKDIVDAWDLGRT
jgi:REP-associated tyrosine transposase